MKKVLLASTALVGAVAVLASPAAAEVKVSAFAQFHASGLDEDTATPAGTQDFDFATNTEVNFSGSTELDNGLTFGFQVQLEADSGGGGGIDENDVWVSGSFGKVVFGNQDGAADALMVSGSFVGVQYGSIGNPTFTGVTAVINGAPTAADVADSSDAIKITYYTPTFNGIKAGVSYAPDLDSGDSSAGGADSWDGGPGLGLEDFVELGVNYSGEFNGVGIDAGLVGIFADSPVGADRDGIGGGLMVSFSGFSVAAGYAQTDNDGGIDTDVFDIGVGYSTGPWTVALGAAFGEQDIAAGDEWELYAGSVTYVVGEGLSVYGTVSGGTAESGGIDNDFTVFSAGILTSF